MKWHLILLALFFGACDTREASSNLLVRNGDPIPSSFKNVVNLSYPDGRTCVATAKDPYHLVTSTSCIGNGVGWQLLNSQTHVVLSAVKSVSAVGDVATILMTKPIVAPWYVSFYKGSMVREGLAVGFGTSGERATGRIWFQENRDGYMIWTAGPKNQIACEGDWGSPVFAGGRLLGILSVVENCATATETRYTKVF